MIWIGGLVKIRRMAARASVGRIGVIPLVTSIAVVRNSHVRPGKGINGIVVKCGRRPSRFAVAGGAIGWELSRCVVRVGCRVIIRCMATCTGIRGGIVIPVMAGSTIVRNSRVCPVQGIKIVVDREARRFPTWRSGMAQGTIRRKAQCLVVGIDGLVKIWGMTSGTFCWCTDITIRMALNTIRRKVRAR